MGLDIFFRRVKSTSEDIDTIIKEEDVRAREELRKFFDRKFKHLAKYENYNSWYRIEWMKFYLELLKFTNYPAFHFIDLIDPLPLKDAKPIADKYVKSFYQKHHAYFRKVNFIYQYFSERLVDECCFVTKEDCLDIIDRCRRVLKDRKLAPELLPTQDGFFFGSTDYDKWYFYDVKCCIKELNGLLRGWKDDERCYVYMSW